MTDAGKRQNHGLKQGPSPNQGHSPIGSSSITAGRSHRLTSGGKAVPLLELWSQMGNIDEEPKPQKG